MPVTLADVAQRAGVSEATASRVLNGRRYVSAISRQRVEAAVRDLDYAPHRAARDLSRARTATVSLLVHHAQYPRHGEGTFSSRVIDGVSRALRQAQHDMLYVQVDDDAVGRLAGLASVRPGRSDGVIVLGPAFPQAAIRRLADTGRPVVIVDNRLPGIDAVMSRNREPMATLTRHLLEAHRPRRVVVLAGPSNWPSTAERVAGIRWAARTSKVALDVLRARETTMRDGAELAGRLLDDPPDAVIAVNDALALGAMHRLRDLGARRPAVTGFDDIAWAELAEPALTTIGVDAHAMGAAAAELLLDRIATTTDTPAREVRVPATLRIRRSCGCDAAETSSP